mmetsp:Transcript_681/g.1846  ORF Transcript_681/g.1846 Transcript_681/m.1846 type:complete len:248 (-) Transcript_681:1884-2627(-)
MHEEPVMTAGASGVRSSGVSDVATPAEGAALRDELLDEPLRADQLDPQRRVTHQRHHHRVVHQVEAAVLHGVLGCPIAVHIALPLAAALGAKEQHRLLAGLLLTCLLDRVSRRLISTEHALTAKTLLRALNSCPELLPQPLGRSAVRSHHLAQLASLWIATLGILNVADASPVAAHGHVVEMGNVDLVQRLTHDALEDHAALVHHRARGRRIVPEVGPVALSRRKQLLILSDISHCCPPPVAIDHIR